METYNLSAITKNIYNSGLTLFTVKTLRDILESHKESTTFNSAFKSPSASSWVDSLEKL